ncbi:MAG: DUF4369 domain-containing protein [Ginsengibacter sp.]
MGKIFFLLLLIIFIPTSSFAQIQKGKFEIKGMLSGFADSTLIYLDNLATSSPSHIDSTLIINNQFHFRGSIKEEVMRVMLRTTNFSDYKYFWLENTTIKFKAEKGKFRDAIIVGSRTQNEQSSLDSAFKSTGKEKEQGIHLFAIFPSQ